VFQSYVDNRRILLSPELSIQTQRSIGSDIMMVLDQCIPSTRMKKRRARPAGHAALGCTQSRGTRGLAAVAVRHRAGRVVSAFAEARAPLGWCEMPFDGFAIGGLAVGEEKHQREDVCELTAALLPEDRPRYLMGVGTPIGSAGGGASRRGHV
jgi:queuine tRNA-ribosyltransferase